MDEGIVLKLIVQTLYRNPGEWFTYRRMANAINMSGIDESLIGAFVISSRLARTADSSCFHQGWNR